MSEKSIRPEQVMASLFEGMSSSAQMSLLARLERGGGSMYRAWASAELNGKAREALTAAADREDQNAKLLELMTTPKAQCERCAKLLALDASAFRCSFQCTFCPDCAGSYRHVCPNCGGELTERATVCAD
ncbi:MAG TPA: DUF1272 domain-containing protein [Candidatus Binataceae bacterium]|jgi:hypothetical protein